MKTMESQKLARPESFRLPDETHVNRVHLRTPDLARALDFYQRVIGFKVVERSKDEASLSATGRPPGFLAFTENRNAAPRRKRTTGLYHFAIRYPTRRDLADALRRIILGATDGATIPAHAAAGTDIGHLNLHVADLAEGEKFFRDFLGLEITAHLGPNGRFLAAGGYHHHVAINMWAGKTPAPKNSVGLISYRFAVPDVRAVAELKERADRFRYETQTAGDVLQIRDPNGHWLELESAPKTRADRLAPDQ